MALNLALKDPQRDIQILDLILNHDANPNKMEESYHGSKRGYSSHSEAAIHTLAFSREIKLMNCLL